MTASRPGIWLGSRFRPLAAGLVLLVLLGSGPGRALAQTQPVQPLSTEARNLFKLGQDALEEELWDQAIYYLQRVVSGYPEYIDAQYLLGLACEGKGMRPEAIRAFQECVKLDKNFVAPYLHLANLELEAGRPAEARLLIQQFADKGNAQAIFGLGVIAYQEGNLQEARERWTQALERDPRFAPTSFNLGVLAYQQGKVPEAVTRFLQAIKLNPKQPAYIYCLAMAYYRDPGTADLARRQLDMLVVLGRTPPKPPKPTQPQLEPPTSKLDPVASAYGELAGGILALEDGGAARKAGKPDQAETYFAQAREALKGAERKFSQAGNEAGVAAATYWRGRSAIVQGQWNQAALLLKQAGREDPRDPDVNLALQASLQTVKAWLRMGARLAWGRGAPTRYIPEVLPQGAPAPGQPNPPPVLPYRQAGSESPPTFKTRLITGILSPPTPAPAPKPGTPEGGGKP